MFTYLQVCRLLNELLVFLQDLLKLFMLLHESLILKGCSLLLNMLPLCCCGLQLLETSSLLWVFRYLLL